VKYFADYKISLPLQPLMQFNSSKSVNKVIHRISTEDTNFDRIVSILSKYQIEGCTFYHGQGMWHGKVEEKGSLVIEIQLDVYNSVINKIAAEIRDCNGQEAVLIQCIPAFSWLV